ncbi:hypothetical protein MICAF_1730002 [Microcystis aeruginosa PCC 9807]|uniref:Uncharacterized protein n=3 Tax=Microcystis TaxID=1125 RepID=I4G2M9_MICAE|nr:hypothetical protein VL20_2612 [Microcystis panniformis FACHB-1757]CCI02190.1 hypothetical protein MICAC_3080009 [Microcystis aeruginosa PCC 9443]CCI16021.1 hypothetical protein MICAF_1730002 [Microcystis aeruginosa PCC 9807]
MLQNFTYIKIHHSLSTISPLGGFGEIKKLFLAMPYPVRIETTAAIEECKKYGSGR